MIWYYIMLFLGTVLTLSFSWLPKITTLPAIGGYDIDGALVTGMGYVHAFFHAIWPLEVMWSGFLVLLGYYSVKMVVRLLLGARAH